MNCCFKDSKSFFSIELLPGMKNGSTMTIRNDQKYGASLASHQRQNEIFMDGRLCTHAYLMGSTRRSVLWAVATMSENNKFEPSIERQTSKIFQKTWQSDFATRQCSTICCETIKDTLEALSWDYLTRPRPGSFWLSFILVHAAWPCWAVLYFVWRYKTLAWALDRFKRTGVLL